MEKYILKKDLVIFYVEANSYPQGISEAHQKLQSLVSDIHQRTVYGVSRPNSKGVIEYKVGTEEKFHGEGKKLNCKTLLLKQGNYNSIFITNYTAHIENISEAFQTLLHQPGLDPEGYCVEIYEGTNDVRCMVRMKV